MNQDDDRRDKDNPAVSEPDTSPAKTAGREDGSSAPERAGTADPGTTESAETKPKRRRKKPKFRRRAEARKDEVLDAALELFTEKGFAATRVEDIAAKAGISKGTVYLYFESKEALMAGLIDRALSPMALQAMTTIDTIGIDPRLVFKTVGGLIAHRFSNPEVLAVPKLILRESVNFPELAQIYRRDVIEQVMPRMVRLIERNIEKGRFRPVDAEMTIRSLIGPIVAHLLLSEVFGITPRDGMEMDRLVENHIDILMNGLSAKPERKNG